VSLQAHRNQIGCKGARHASKNRTQNKKAKKHNRDGQGKKEVVAVTDLDAKQTTCIGLFPRAIILIDMD
jgi:hypothetical protein